MASKFDIKLKPGDEAPAFTATDQDGQSVSLAQFRGKRVVLYFYPRDNTPGCTVEACAFRDARAQLLSKGAVVLGVSTDSIEAHQRFARRHHLSFPLLADVDKKIVTAYGVWGEKSFLGRRFMGVHRATFLIGPDGRIQKVWPDVKVAKHVAEVLATLG